MCQHLIGNKNRKLTAKILLVDITHAADITIKMFHC